MPSVNFVVETKVSRSSRARQVEALFDVPAQEKCQLNWKGNVPLEMKPWNVGLIVGPSGCGKSSVAKHLFGEDYHRELEWHGASVIDDFREDLPISEVTAACSSVGFNTVPAWLRPHAVLSNGEKFRVEMARRLLECGDPIVVDEFTSVVDRQVAQIGSHAIAKHVRRHERKFVAVTCHFDIIEWLQPDWVLEPATMDFRWRSVQPRPQLEIQVARVDYGMWSLFAPYHYMTAELSRAAVCYAAFVNGQPAAFTGILHFPHPKVRDIKRCSRLVTLPDWQGLGIAFVLIETLAAAYKTKGFRMRCYPAHPTFVRAYDRNKKWTLKKEPGKYATRASPTTGIGDSFGGRPCAVFEYVGGAMTTPDAKRVLG